LCCEELFEWNDELEVIGLDAIRNMALLARRMLAVIPRLSGFLFPGLVTEDADAPLRKAGESCSDDPKDSKGRRSAAVDVAAAGAA